VDEMATVSMMKVSDHASAIPEFNTKWRAALYLMVVTVYFNVLKVK
jgi:hypothetical protein